MQPTQHSDSVFAALAEARSHRLRAASEARNEEELMTSYSPDAVLQDTDKPEFSAIIFSAFIKYSAVRNKSVTAIDELCKFYSHNPYFSHREGHFCEAFSKNGEINILIDIDFGGHAKKRKLLNLCFADKLVHAATNFVIEHVDCWHALIGEDIGSDEWSRSINFSDRIDNVICDIMGGISFGCSYGTKEPGDNPLKNPSQHLKGHGALLPCKFS